MDEFDLRLGACLSNLAAIINRASQSEATTAEAMKVSKVPTNLLIEARQELKWFADTEYTTREIREACNRQL